MLHSVILTSHYFERISNIFSWIGKYKYIEMLFTQFSNLMTYVRVVISTLPSATFNSTWLSGKR